MSELHLHDATIRSEAAHDDNGAETKDDLLPQGSSHLVANPQPRINASGVRTISSEDEGSEEGMDGDDDEDDEGVDETKRPWKCGVCGRGYATEHNMFRHAHQSVQNNGTKKWLGPFRCHVCKKSFHTREVALQHGRNEGHCMSINALKKKELPYHATTLPQRPIVYSSGWACKSCRAPFTETHFAVFHALKERHLPKGLGYAHTAATCLSSLNVPQSWEGSAFEVKELLSKVLRSPTTSREYCKIFTSQFTRMNACPQCTKQYASLGAFKQHYSSYHASPSTNDDAPPPGKVSKKQRRVSGIKICFVSIFPYECESCHMRFAEPEELTDHSIDSASCKPQLDVKPVDLQIIPEGSHIPKGKSKLGKKKERRKQKGLGIRGREENRMQKSVREGDEPTLATPQTADNLSSTTLPSASFSSANQRKKGETWSGDGTLLPKDVAHVSGPVLDLFTPGKRPASRVNIAGGCLSRSGDISTILPVMAEERRRRGSSPSLLEEKREVERQLSAVKSEIAVLSSESSRNGNDHGKRRNQWEWPEYYKMAKDESSPYSVTESPGVQATHSNSPRHRTLAGVASDTAYQPQVDELSEMVGVGSYIDGCHGVSSRVVREGKADPHRARESMLHNNARSSSASINDQNAQGLLRTGGRDVSSPHESHTRLLLQAMSRDPASTVQSDPDHTGGSRCLPPPIEKRPPLSVGICGSSEERIRGERFAQEAADNRNVDTPGTSSERLPVKAADKGQYAHHHAGLQLEEFPVKAASTEDNLRSLSFRLPDVNPSPPLASDHPRFPSRSASNASALHHANLDRGECYSLPGAVPHSGSDIFTPSAACPTNDNVTYPTNDQNLLRCWSTNDNTNDQDILRCWSTKACVPSQSITGTVGMQYASHSEGPHPSHYSQVKRDTALPDIESSRRHLHPHLSARTAGDSYTGRAPGVPYVDKVPGDPYAGRVLGVPYAGKVPGDPYVGRVPGVPYTGKVPGDPYAGRVSGVPYAGKVPGDPYAGRVPGVPYAGKVPGDPYAGRVPRVPYAGKFPGDPYAGRIPEVPYAGKVPGDPYAGRVPGVRYAGKVPGDPYAGRVPGVPYAGKVPGEPYAGRVPGEPYAGRVPGDPYAGRVPGVLYTGRVPGDPHTRRIQGNPYAARVPGEPHTRRVPGNPYAGRVPGVPYTGGAPGDPYTRRVPENPYAGGVPGDSYTGRGPGDRYAGRAAGDPYAGRVPGDPYP